MMEAYIYTYVNKETGKTYIGSRSAYKGSCYDDFNIKYFSSSKDKQFRQDMADGKLEGQIILVMNSENANKKIQEIEAKIILAYWERYGKENSYNHHARFKWNTIGLEPWNKGKKGAQIAWNKGLPMSDEQKKKDSESHKGKKYSEETKKKLSDIHKGSNNAFYGKHHTEQTKELLRKPKVKYKWLTPDGKIVEMDKANASRFHKDWILTIEKAKND